MYLPLDNKSYDAYNVVNKHVTPVFGVCGPVTGS